MLCSGQAYPEKKDLSESSPVGLEDASCQELTSVKKMNVANNHVSLGASFRAQITPQLQSMRPEQKTHLTGAQTGPMETDN